MAISVVALKRVNPIRAVSHTQASAENYEAFFVKSLLG